MAVPMISRAVAFSSYASDEAIIRHINEQNWLLLDSETPRLDTLKSEQYANTIAASRSIALKDSVSQIFKATVEVVISPVVIVTTLALNAISILVNSCRFRTDFVVGSIVVIPILVIYPFGSALNRIKIVVINIFSYVGIVSVETAVKYRYHAFNRYIFGQSLLSNLHLSFKGDSVDGKFLMLFQSIYK